MRELGHREGERGPLRFCSQRTSRTDISKYNSPMALFNPSRECWNWRGRKHKIELGRSVEELCGLFLTWDLKDGDQ